MGQQISVSSLVSPGQENLLPRVTNFLGRKDKETTESIKNELFQNFNIFTHSLKEAIKQALKWAEYFYNNFFNRYEEIKILSRELSQKIEQLTLEKKQDISFLQKFTDIPNAIKNEYQHQINRGYNELERNMIPLQTRINQIEEIIERTKQLITEKKQWKKITEIKLLKDFNNKYADIITAMKLYTLHRTYILAFQKEIAEKYTKKAA